MTSVKVSSSYFSFAITKLSALVKLKIWICAFVYRLSQMRRKTI